MAQEMYKAPDLDPDHIWSDKSKETAHFLLQNKYPPRLIARKERIKFKRNCLKFAISQGTLFKLRRRDNVRKRVVDDPDQCI